MNERCQQIADMMSYNVLVKRYSEHTYRSRQWWCISARWSIDSHYTVHKAAAVITCTISN